MSAGQREAGGAVIESSAVPVDGRAAVTEGTVLWKSGGLMRRVVGTVEVREVAVDAGGASQAVIVVAVARRALLRRVSAHQGKAGRGVIEGSGPVGDGRAMAEGAILRKSGGFVRRVVG